MICFVGSNLEVLGTLLDQGADIELFDHNGLTTLHWAVKMGREEVAAFLLDRGWFSILESFFSPFLLTNNSTNIHNHNQVPISMLEITMV